MFYTCYYVHFRSGTDGGASRWVLEVRSVLILIIVQWRTGSWESRRRRPHRTWWWVKSWNAKLFLLILLPLFQSLALKTGRWCGMCAISCRFHHILASHINMIFVLFCMRRLLLLYRTDIRYCVWNLSQNLNFRHARVCERFTSESNRDQRKARKFCIFRESAGLL